MLTRLRKRKAFTLIELLVVIAIIGVLAAILIPIFWGYMTRSKVTSADSVAANLKKKIQNFLVNADADGYGMLLGNTAIEPVITVNNKVWSITITESPLSDYFNSHNTSITWGGSGVGHFGDPVVGATADELLMIELADEFPEVVDAYISFRAEAGHVMALYYTVDTTNAFTIQTFGPGGWSSDVYNWDNKNQGITTEGYVVGTCPVLALG